MTPFFSIRFPYRDVSLCGHNRGKLKAFKIIKKKKSLYLFETESLHLCTWNVTSNIFDWERKKVMQTLLPRQQKPSWLCRRRQTFPRVPERPIQKEKNTYWIKTDNRNLRQHSLFGWFGSCTSGHDWRRSTSYVFHTGTTKPCCLSLSTRSMTAACEEMRIYINR